MVETVLDKIPVDEIKARREEAMEALEERFREGVKFAKKIGRTSTEAAEELLDDTTRQIKRHPAGSVIGALITGLLIGGIVGFVIKRK